MAEQRVTPEDLERTLTSLSLSRDEIAGVMARIREATEGILIYGSQARGDQVAQSDFDLLRLTERTDQTTFKAGRVSVSSYTRSQLRSADGTLFGTHLKRDAKILLDPTGDLAAILTGISTADPNELLSRVRRYSTILNQPGEEKATHVSGLVRLARYLLRTAVYAQSMLDGPPCFSVRELAQRFSDPSLVTVLASDPQVTGPPSLTLLEELLERLRTVIGPLPGHDYGSLAALAVAQWDKDRSMAALAIRAADEDDIESLDYSDLPKVLL